MLGVKPASRSNIAGKKSDPAGNLYYLLSVLYYIINQNILTLKSAEMKRCEVVSGGGREGGRGYRYCSVTSPVWKYQSGQACGGAVAMSQEDVTGRPEPIDISKKAVGPNC